MSLFCWPYPIFLSKILKSIGLWNSVMQSNSRNIKWASVHFSQQGVWCFHGEALCRSCIALTSSCTEFKQDCWNLSNSSFIDVEKQKIFGSDPRKRWKKENEAEGESPFKKPEWQDSRCCFYTEEQEVGEKEGKVKVHPLHPLCHQMYWALYLAYQGFDLPVQIPGTSTYVIGHLTLISNVPQQNWSNFQAIHALKDDGLYVTEHPFSTASTRWFWTL